MKTTTLLLDTYTWNDDEDRPNAVQVQLTPARLRYFWRLAFFVRRTSVCLMQEYNDTPVWGEVNAEREFVSGGTQVDRIGGVRLVVSEDAFYYVAFFGDVPNEIVTQATPLRSVSQPPWWIRIGWTLCDAMDTLSRFLRREPRPLTEADLELMEQEIGEAMAQMKQLPTRVEKTQHYRKIKGMKENLSHAAQVVYDIKLD